MGVSAPSLHRKSTDSLILAGTPRVHQKFLSTKKMKRATALANIEEDSDDNSYPKESIQRTCRREAATEVFEVCHSE